MKTSFGILLLITALTHTACNRDPIQPSQPLDEDVKEEKYSLVNITYTAISGVATEEIIEQRPSLEYTNRTSLQQTVVVNPDSIFERSTFKREPKQDYSVDNQNQIFSVPIEIQNGQPILGGKKWVYAERETKLPTELNFKDSVHVESGKKMTVNLSVIYKKIQAIYTAQLKGQVSGRLVNVNGTWSGVYPLRKNLTYNVQNL